AYTFRITPDQPKQIDESGHTFCRLTRARGKKTRARAKLKSRKHPASPTNGRGGFLLPILPKSPRLTRQGASHERR
ncbi:hypothetical protein, partial [Corynebacterium urealyticum]|uniref:hypothetical protein n=1 Tax=Corynebacterium urealyticum TaxID=43771 RepID=UPI001CA3635D